MKMEQKLEKLEKKLKLYEEAQEHMDYPLRIKECCYEECKAMSITNDDSVALYSECENIVSCDFNTKNCPRQYYCDKHDCMMCKLENDTDVNVEEVINCCSMCYETGIPTEKGYILII